MNQKTNRSRAARLSITSWGLRVYRHGNKDFFRPVLLKAQAYGKFTIVVPKHHELLWI